MRHPAGDLAPKAVMKLVLDAAPPTPRAVGAHEQHLAATGAADGQQRDAAKLISQLRVHGEHLAAGPAFDHAGGPVKTGEHFPNLVVHHFVGVEACEQMAASAVREREHRLVLQADAGGLGVVEHDRHQLLQLAVHQREVIAAPPRHEDQPAALLLDEALDQLGVFLAQLPFADADVAEKNHVVTRQHFARTGEGGEVVAPAAGADVWVKQHAAQVHTGVAGEGVSQEAVFPARLRIDDQHSQLDHAHGDVKRRRVIVAQPLVRLDRELQPQVELADLARVPHDRVVEPAVRREGHFLGGQLLRALHEAHLGGDVARQVTLHRVRDGDLLAEQAVRRRGDFLHREVGDRFVLPGDDAVNRDALVAVARGDADRRRAKVPVAIAQQQHRLEVALLLEHRAKRAAQVGADLPRLAKRVRRAQVRRRGECTDQHLGAGLLERRPERALVLRIDPGAACDDVVGADDVTRLHAPRGVGEDRDLRRIGALYFPDKLRAKQRERQHRHRHES